jgi:hypothetical protein
MEKYLTPRQLSKYRERVERVLEDEAFVIGARERKLINERTANGRRYFYLVAKRHEGNKMIERFIKVPQNDSQKLLLPFKRQVEFAKFLKKHQVIKTRGVVDANCDLKRGTPFAIMETFPAAKAKIGFIEGDKGADRLGAREARRVLNQLLKLHAVSIGSLPPALKKILKAHKGGYKDFKKEVGRLLDKKVKPLGLKRGKESFYRVLERHFGVHDLKGSVNGLLERARPFIDAKANRGPALAHGDMAPNNLYVFDSGEVELLDLEWVGLFNNKALAMIDDFGNLRARAWSNRKFREALDNELIKIYRRRQQEELGKMIVRLSILHAHLLLAGFFENYPWPKQKERAQTRRRILTERDIAKALA